MIRSLFFLATVMVFAVTADADEKQAELNAACETAREVKLAPMRDELVNDCVEKERGDREFCTDFFAGWDGNRREGLSRLFYDLPECEIAYEYQRDRSGR